MNKKEATEYYIKHYIESAKLVQRSIYAGIILVTAFLFILLTFEPGKKVGVPFLNMEASHNSAISGIFLVYLITGILGNIALGKAIENRNKLTKHKTALAVAESYPSIINLSLSMSMVIVIAPMALLAMAINNFSREGYLFSMFYSLIFSFPYLYLGIKLVDFKHKKYLDDCKKQFEKIRGKK